MATLFISLTPWLVYWTFAIPAQFKLAGFFGVAISIFLNLRHAGKPKLLEVASTPFFFLSALAFNYADMLLHLSFAWLAGVALIPVALRKPAFLQQYFAEEGTPPMKRYTMVSAAWGGVFISAAMGSWYGTYLVPAGLAVLALALSLLYGRSEPYPETAEE